MGSGEGGSVCLISGAPLRWPEWRRACRAGGRRHHGRVSAISMRSERAPSWRATDLRTSSGQRSGSAPHKSRARRRARPLHPTAACRGLPCDNPRRPKGPPPRNGDLGGPPVLGQGPASEMHHFTLIAAPRWPSDPVVMLHAFYRYFEAPNPHVRRRTMRTFGAMRSRRRGGPQPPPAGRSRPVWRTQAARRGYSVATTLVASTCSGRRNASGGALGTCPARKRP